MRNLNIFLKVGAWCEGFTGSACLTFIVSTGPRIQDLSGIQDLPEVALVLLWCVPSFCPLSRFALGMLALNMALFRVLRAFLEGFSCLVWVCVVLVICVACVAFVRVYS